MHFMRLTPNQDGFINFGWRGWEGDLPSFIRHCSENQTLDERTMTYYDETIQTSARRILPLLSYFHQDSGPISLEELPYRSSAIYGKCNSKFNR